MTDLALLAMLSRANAVNALLDALNQQSIVREIHHECDEQDGVIHGHAPNALRVDQHSRLKLAEQYAQNDEFNKAFSQYWRILNRGD